MSIDIRKQEIEKKFGPWTAHNIRLSDGTYTIREDVVGDQNKLRRIVQLVSELDTRPTDQLRVLDLACLEGLYSIEFALRGANVVGIEGREANLAKAQFASEALGLRNVEFVRDDVRNLSREKFGEFDVVLCLGILYHLQFPDVFKFLESIHAVCRVGGVVVIDTHVSRRPWVKRTYRGESYFGSVFLEHPPFAGPDQRRSALWSSLDNTVSFWPTKPSLLNFMADQGYSSVLECHVPSPHASQVSRITLAAVKRTPIRLESTHTVAPGTQARLPEWPNWWTRIRNLLKFRPY